MMNKILVKLYVPTIEQQYDIWLPLNRRIHSVIKLLIKMVDEYSDGVYKPIAMPLLYDKLTGEQYDLNLTVKETSIRNGSEIILI